MAEPIREYTFSRHALRQMARRQVSLDVVHLVMLAPEQRVSVAVQREVLQGRVSIGGVRYLVRVVVAVESQPAEIITVYRTSKIAKYWRVEG